MLLNARRLRQEGTDAELILLAVEDITERKQAEEALRESEGRFRTLDVVFLDGIAAADLDGYITECNQAYAEMLGYTREELRRDQVPGHNSLQVERSQRRVRQTGDGPRLPRRVREGVHQEGRHRISRLSPDLED